MAARRPFWKWHHWKSIGFCLWPLSTCIWNLKLKFQSKLDLCSGNHVVYRQTDRRTDGRTDKVNPVYPPSNFVGRGYNESFISESAWEFSARDVSAKDSRSSVWCWKEYNFLPINTKQTKNKKQFRSPSSCTIVKVRTLNGAYFDASMSS